MVSIGQIRSILTALLLSISIIEVDGILNLKIGLNGIFFFGGDSTGTSFSMITKMGPTSNPVYLRYFDIALSTTSTNYDITNLAVANPNYYYAKARCSPYNQLNAINNSFLIFTTKQLSIITNAAILSNNMTLLLSYIGTNQIIEQVFYLTGSNAQIFLLCVNGNSTNYSIKYYNMNTSTQNLITTSVANTSTFIKVIRSSSKIFLLFNTGIYIYQQNVTPIYVTSIPFPTALTSFVKNNYSISVDGTRLAYAINDSITIINISNFSAMNTIHQFSFNYTVDDIQLFGAIVLINWNTSSCTQYDIHQSAYTNAVTRNGFYNLVKRMILSSSDTIIFIDDNFVGSSVSMYTFISSYPSNGTCFISYYLSGGQCMKNLSYVPPAPPPMPTTPSMSNTNQTPSVQIQNPNATKITLVLDQIMFYIGRVLSVTTATTLTPRSFVCLIFFMDDLYYYRFHRIDYPSGVKMFMEKIDLIFLYRFTPEFLRQAAKINDKLNQLQIKQDEKIIYEKFTSSHIHNPESFYFLNSTQQIYINNFLGCAITFAFTKILYFLFYWINKKCKKGRKIMLCLKRNSRNWSFLMLILQSNVAKLGLQCSVQLWVPVNLYFIDKINLLFSLFILFSILSYSTYFLIIVYQFQSKNAAETLLTYSRYSNKSFFFQTYSLLLRTFVRAIIQGLLIQNYFYQVVSLAITDGVFSLLVLLFRKQFCHKLAFLLFFLYCFLFLVLDLCFSLNFRYPNLFANIDYDLVTFIIACCIVASSLLLFAFIFLYNIYLFCLNTYKKSKNNSGKKALKKQHVKQGEAQKEKNQNPLPIKNKFLVFHFAIQKNKQQLLNQMDLDKQNKFSKNQQENMILVQRLERNVKQKAKNNRNINTTIVNNLKKARK